MLNISHSFFDLKKNKIINRIIRIKNIIKRNMRPCGPNILIKNFKKNSNKSFMIKNIIK